MSTQLPAQEEQLPAQEEQLPAQEVQLPAQEEQHAQEERQQQDDVDDFDYDDEDDQKCAVVEGGQEQQEQQRRRSARPQIQRQHFESNAFENEMKHFSCLTTMSQPNFDDEPTSYHQAISTDDSEQWIKAMQEELLSHSRNSTFIVQDKQREIKAIGSRWVYKKKVNEKGEVTRFKARLVAKGFSQEEGIHFNETFAPTVRSESFRSIVAIAAQEGLELHGLDVDTAFLIPSLPREEAISMRPPSGFADLCASIGINFKPGQVLQLHKCIYGLKQSGHYWNNELTEALRSFGFKQSNADPCVMVKKTANDGIIYICFYVDDILLAGSRKGVDLIKKLLNGKFPIKDLGEPRQFTGIALQRLDKHSIRLSQPSFTRNLLQKFNMQDCKPATTPAAAERLVAISQSEQERAAMKKVPYRSAIGSLLWLTTTTRPDIAFAVGQVARFSHEPAQAHWTAVKRIFRYLQHTKDFGLHYQKTSKAQLIGFSDSDWAGDKTRQSTGGFVFQLGSSTISWKSKLIRTICLSSMEAEIIQLSLTAQEGIWLARLFKDLELQRYAKLPITIRADNQSAIAACKNFQISSRTKHVDIRNLFVRQRVLNGDFILVYLQSSLMTADIHTKPLAAQLLIRHRDGMSVTASP